MKVKYRSRKLMIQREQIIQFFQILQIDFYQPINPNYKMNTQNIKQRPLHPSLQAKLQLLDNIQKGNFQRVRQIAYALSKVGRTNPQLYGKLSTFVQQHKQQLNDIDSQDDQQEPQIVNVDDDFVEGKEWDSDDSIQYESEQEEVQKENAQNKLMTQKQPIHKKELFREVKNIGDRRSVSTKKFTPANNTYQFKSPVMLTTKKTAELKPSNSKAQLHRNSAIGKVRNLNS